jgi:lipopolysaccharide cholinephosphotransferase
LWIVELDLLLEIDRVCKKYNIRYFLFWGTLLGAVRHHGFIPWDDDIDIIMPRADYEEFLKHGDEFNDPYFLQNCHTDKDFYFVHSRLRNSNTAAIQRPFACRDFNHGIFVDILYFDNFDIDEEGKMVWGKLNCLISKISTYMKLNNPYPNQKDRERIALYDDEDPDALFNHIQKLSQYFNDRDAEYVASTSAIVYGMNKSCFLKEDFASTLMIDFEGFQFPIPIGWDRILKTTYGDYMTLPPTENRGKWHGSLWYAPEQSYKSIKASSQYMQWLKEDY